MIDPMLTVRDLAIQHTNQESNGGLLVSGVHLRLEPGKSLCMVGETGSGKSLVARAVLGLLPLELSAVGNILYHGSSLTDLSPEVIRQFWGRRVFLFPQEPALALNPTMRARTHIQEVLTWVRPGNGSKTSEDADALMRAVGLSPVADGRKYPCQLSGGMRQRLAAAVTLAEPADLILADEPTKGMDAFRRDQVVDLLKQMLSRGKALLVITHDLEVALRLGGNVAVMYSGRIVEQGPVERVLTRPAHPYTEALMRALPANGLHPIPLRLHDRPMNGGCVFAPRCAKAIDLCFHREPEAVPVTGGCRCHAG